MKDYYIKQMPRVATFGVEIIPTENFGSIYIFAVLTDDHVEMFPNILAVLGAEAEAEAEAEADAE